MQYSYTWWYPWEICVDTFFISYLSVEDSEQVYSITLYNKSPLAVTDVFYLLPPKVKDVPTIPSLETFFIHFSSFSPQARVSDWSPWTWLLLSLNNWRSTGLPTATGLLTIIVTQEKTYTTSFVRLVSKKYLLCWWHLAFETKKNSNRIDFKFLFVSIRVFCAGLAVKEVLEWASFQTTTLPKLKASRRRAYSSWGTFTR